MNFRYTKHQVARGARADAEQNERLYLFKHVDTLRATYQIRWLAEEAERRGTKLVLRVPKACRIAPSLSAFRREHPKIISIERA